MSAARMSDLYDTDVVAWSEQQTNALRRRAANELDWDNIAGEIEDVGLGEVNATLAQIDNILRHRIYLLGWPAEQSVRRWQAELDEFTRQLHRHYKPSMTTGGNPRVTDAVVRESYTAAVGYCVAHMDEPPTVPLPAACPWTLDELLGQTP
jgi:hypothetical protein